METKRDKTTPRDRILEVASQLFFEQGYRATGINEVIAKSGVAKATFYNHFPTKDDLCLVYLQDRNTTEYETVVAYVHDHDTPEERFLAVMGSLCPWLEANSLRGCAFLNMVAEVPDPRNLLRREGVKHYESLRKLIKELTLELIDSDRDRYQKMDVDTVTDDYLTILGGAIAMAEIYHDLWPVKHASAMVKKMIE